MAQLTPKDLNPLASAPQGLDNQFVPQKWLTGKSLKQLSNKLSKEKRTEYLRSLIYSPQVVLNRAYLVNSQEINQDFLEESKQKNTFRKLMEEQVIIPYLFKEKSFEEILEFSVNEKGKVALKEITKNLDVPYLRLSWDDEENNNEAERISKVFSGYLLQMPMIGEKIANSVGIITEQGKKAFAKKLRELGRFCYDVLDDENRNYITREDVYKRFICVDGTNPSDGIYDKDKEFWKELKLLFDLKYNVNLPDRLEIHTLTGRDVPDRSALHEIDLELFDNKNDGVKLDLSKLFGEIVQGKLNEALWIESIRDLNLDNIYEVRNLPEFGIFMAATEELKESVEDSIKNKDVKPIKYSNYFEAFTNYQRAIASIASKANQSYVQPYIEMVLEFGGFILTIVAKDKMAKFSAGLTTIDDTVSSFTAKISAKALMGMDIHNASLNQDLVKTKLADPQGEVMRLREKLMKEGYTIIDKDHVDDDEGTMEDNMELGQD